MNRTLTGCLLLLALCSASARSQLAPVEIGSRLELFVDEFWIEEFEGEARLQLQRPTPREVVLVIDRPWGGEGLQSLYHFSERRALSHVLPGVALRHEYYR